MDVPNDPTNRPLSRSGIPGLDGVLGGRFTPNRVDLIEGDPGAGETTLALQYLMEGKRLREVGPVVELVETRSGLAATAASHGWDLRGIEVVERVASEDEREPENPRTLFHPAEIELGQIRNSFRCRRQIPALERSFIGVECTLLTHDDRRSKVNGRKVGSLMRPTNG